MTRIFFTSVTVLAFSVAGCSSEVGPEDFQAEGLSQEASVNAAAALRNKTPGRCYDFASAMMAPDQDNPLEYSPDVEKSCSNEAIKEDTLHPRKVVPPPDPKLFEPPPVTTPPEVFEHMTQEQINEFNKKQVEAICASGSCSKSDVNPEELRNGLVLLAARDELSLRRGGLPSDTAKKAIWAMAHAPQSSCANLAHIIMMDVDAPASYTGLPGDDPQYTVMEIEAHHLCDRENLNK